MGNKFCVCTHSEIPAHTKMWHDWKGVRPCYKRGCPCRMFVLWEREPLELPSAYSPTPEIANESHGLTSQRRYKT